MAVKINIGGKPAKVPGLCVDEGCPHYGTPHVHGKGQGEVAFAVLTKDEWSSTDAGSGIGKPQDSAGVKEEETGAIMMPNSWVGYAQSWHMDDGWWVPALTPASNLAADMLITGFLNSPNPSFAQWLQFDMPIWVEKVQPEVPINMMSVVSDGSDWALRVKVGVLDIAFGEHLANGLKKSSWKKVPKA